MLSNIVNVAYLSKNNEEKQKEFRDAVDLAFENGPDYLNFYKDLTPVEDIPEIVLTDFVDDLELSDNDITTFSLTEHGEEMALLSLSTLKALDWNIVSVIYNKSSGYFDVHQTVFIENAVEYGVQIENTYQIDLTDLDHEILHSEPLRTRVQVTIGSTGFVQHVISHSVSLFPTDQILIVTDVCRNLLLPSSECDIGCLETLSNIFKGVICIDESSKVKDDWIDDIWMPQIASSFEVDYQLVEMYDNACWAMAGAYMTESLLTDSIQDIVDNSVVNTFTDNTLTDDDVFAMENARQDFKQLLAKTVQEIEFKGITKSNPPSPISLSINVFSFDSFYRVLSSNTASVAPDILKNNMAIYGYTDIPLSYEIESLNLVGSSMVMAFIVMALLFFVTMWALFSKLIVLRFGVFSKKECIGLVGLGIIGLVMTAMGLLDVKYACQMKDIVLPAIRLVVLAAVMLSHEHFSRVVLNRGLRLSIRLSETPKLAIMGILFLASVIGSIVVNWLGGYNYGTALFKKSGSSTMIMLEVCRSDLLYHSSEFRWISSFQLMLRVLVSVVLVTLILRLQLYGHDIKGFQKRNKYLKIRIFGFAFVTSTYLLLLGMIVGSSECENEMEHCATVGDGVAFTLIRPLFELTFFFFLIWIPVVQEVYFGKTQTKDVSEHANKGVKTILNERRKDYLFNAVLEKRINAQDMICPVELLSGIDSPLSGALNSSTTDISRSLKYLSNTDNGESCQISTLIRAGKAPSPPIWSTESVPAYPCNGKSEFEEMEDFKNFIESCPYDEIRLELRSLCAVFQQQMRVYVSKEAQLIDITKNLGAFIDKTDILVVRLRREKKNLKIRKFTVLPSNA